jgi:hypothetical protein
MMHQLLQTIIHDLINVSVKKKYIAVQFSSFSAGGCMIRQKDMGNACLVIGYRYMYMQHMMCCVALFVLSVGESLTPNQN